MKICSIGNSFLQDAHKWLHKLAKANGVEFETANLYIFFGMIFNVSV